VEIIKMKKINLNFLPYLFHSMPYCEAIVLESLRAFVGPAVGIAHRAMRDTTLCGFDIPKDTMMISIFDEMTHDSSVYKNPYAFHPGNFLDDEGKLSIPSKFHPFALGKHRCIGEGLAKSNLFLFLTTLLQNFYFDIPAGNEIPTDLPADNVTPSVRDYQGLIILRN
jgi:cytochrome P450